MEKTEEPVPTHLAIMWSGKKELRMVSEMNNISLSEFIRSSVERIAPEEMGSRCLVVVSDSGYASRVSF